jgi:hypothetical protein
MVEVGEDFHGNDTPGANGLMENTNSFQGNSIVSTPTPTANQIELKMDKN